MQSIDVSLLFLKSALTLSVGGRDISSAQKWIKLQNSLVKVKIQKIALNRLNGWDHSIEEGRIRHVSGKYFSIDGIKIKTNWGSISEWQQPIINQPEIGFLGFIAKEIDGVLQLLVQAKIEPGNLNHVQLSPTLQATRSNYTMVHKGKRPLYLDYFQNATPKQILLDQLQSEQGSRFLKKRNRNIIIKVEEDFPVAENFIWLTLGQIKELMKLDDIVNMDARTVISGISYGNFSSDVIRLFSQLNNQVFTNRLNVQFLESALSTNGAIHSIDEILTFLAHLKSNFDLDIERVPLITLEGWEVTESDIRHVNGKYFKVIGVQVEIENREVTKWTQPMIQPVQEGLIAFVCKEINGLLHFAVQAKLECGNHDVIEFAPTIQCLTGNYRDSTSEELPFLSYVLNAESDQIVYDTLQSEEGGRFFQELNRNMIIIAGSEIPEVLPPNYIWMSLNQMYTFLKFNNYLNIQARSLVAAISLASPELLK
jgi:dTDP-4-dehydro-6-deoxy-alpha-D-glucopyranose 2,3-dehydratase